MFGCIAFINYYSEPVCTHFSTLFLMCIAFSLLLMVCLLCFMPIEGDAQKGI